MYRLIMLANVSILFMAAGLSQAAVVSGTGENLQSELIANMAHTAYSPLPTYHFAFGTGSRDITDGSDFQAVRNAMGTWINEPGSGLSASEGVYGGTPSSGYNGINEISWVNPTTRMSDPWSNLLGLSDGAVATVVTWYNSATRQVVERDLFFNNVDYHWRTDTDGQQNGGFYVENVALHEIGHIFGLKDLYNPGQSGWQEWMGEGNEEYTMYGYTYWLNENVTLNGVDIAAMAMLHPVPEPPSVSLVTLAAGVLLVIRRR